MERSLEEGRCGVTLAMSIVTQTRNSFPRTSGYSPLQWVLGVPELRLPGSLLAEEPPNLEVMEHAEDPRSQMAKTLNVREAARIAQVRMDTDSRVRRALLRQSTPTRGPFPIGSYVYFYKTQQQPGASRQYRWFGPGRVIGVELRNPRRLEDEDPGTEGGAPHSYWIRYGPMRFASEDELLAAHSVPHYAVANQQVRGARSFVDVRGLGLQLPLADEQVEPELDRVPVRDSPSLHLPAVPGQQELPPVPEDEPFEYTPSIAPAPEPQHDDIGVGVQDEPLLPVAVGSVFPSRQTTAEPEPQPPLLQQPQTPGFQTARLDPSRLDGVPGPMRTRREGRELGPYFSEQEPWPDGCEDPTDAARRHRLRELLGYEDTGSDEDESEEESSVNFTEQALQLTFLTGALHWALLTGKAVKSEIDLKSLSPEDRAKFDVSMGKEWSSWGSFRAVDELTEEEIKLLPPDTKIVGTRWVHTDKNSKPRLIAYHMAKKTGKTKEQVDKEFPFMAKSRLVVQGCQEDGMNIRSDSPTASLLAFNLICAIAVMMGWVLAAFDASTAYLQSSGIDRLLILRAPKPPPPGVMPGTLFRARGSIYMEQKMLAEVGGRSCCLSCCCMVGSCPRSSQPCFTCTKTVSLLECWQVMSTTWLHVALARSTRTAWPSSPMWSTSRRKRAPSDSAARMLSKSPVAVSHWSKLMPLSASSTRPWIRTAGKPPACLWLKLRKVTSEPWLGAWAGSRGKQGQMWWWMLVWLLRQWETRRSKMSLPWTKLWRCLRRQLISSGTLSSPRSPWRMLWSSCTQTRALRMLKVANPSVGMSLGLQQKPWRMEKNLLSWCLRQSPPQ